jgi:uroporphyrinogen-III synthase
LTLVDAPGQRPLRVLLTRPLDQALETAAWVRRQGGEPLVYPCLRVEPVHLAELRQAIAELPQFAAIALTSVHAARALLPLLPSGQSLPPLFVLGQKTACELIGIQPLHVVDGASATARTLALQLIRDLGPSPSGQRVLFPQASEGRDDLPRLLGDAGITVSRIVAYRTVAVEPSALAEAVHKLRAGQVDLVPLGSPRTALVLLQAIGDDAADVLRLARVGAIGQTTAQALRDLGVRVDVVAEQASFEDLVGQLATVRQLR